MIHCCGYTWQPTFTYTHCKSAAVEKKRAAKSVKGLLCSHIIPHCDNPRHGASYQLLGVFRGNTPTLKSLPTQPTRGCVNTLPSRLPLMPPLFVALLPTCIAIFLQTSVTRSFKFSSTVFERKFPSTNAYPCLVLHFFFLLRLLLLVSKSTNAALLFPSARAEICPSLSSPTPGIFPPQPRC